MNATNLPSSSVFTGREGTLDCKLHWFLKFYNHVFLFVGSQTIETLSEILLVGSKLINQYLKFKEGIILFIILEYLQWFIVIVLLSYPFRSLRYYLIKYMITWPNINEYQPKDRWPKALHCRTFVLQSLDLMGQWFYSNLRVQHSSSILSFLYSNPFTHILIRLFLLILACKKKYWI